MPKRNIILAIALSLGVYILWFSFLPKNQKQAAPSASAPEVKRESVPAKKPEALFTETLITIDGTQAKVRVDSGASLVEFFREEPKNKSLIELLPKKSVFLGTEFANDPLKPWGVKHSDKNYLQLTLPISKEAQLLKEYRLETQENNPSLLKLHYQNSSQESIFIDILIGADDTRSKTDHTEVFVGYKGKKGLIIQKAGSKQENLALEIAAGKGVEALGLMSQYNLAFIYGFSQIQNLESVRRDANTNNWFCRLKLKPGETLELPFYIGFKNEATLKNFDLENILYGGWLGPLKRLIHSAVKFFYKITGNYGVAIILLTLAFQVVLLPFTLKNLKLTQKMKDLAPKIKIIQEKFKSDPKRMQTEMMQLYKTQGANPLGGCLLMLVQMPIFFALYSALNENYDLYGAPFMLWIKNLAAPDPTYILPILMGAAMLLQTKMSSGPAMDQSQKMLSYMMPVMFTFMFLKFPSGLVLYWFTSNLASMALMKFLPKFLDNSA